MGPPQAVEVLREGLAMGADEAYLLTDRKVGGWIPWQQATAWHRQSRKLLNYKDWTISI